MIVTPIAHTVLHGSSITRLVPDYEVYSDPYVSDADALGEFAGRNCYKAWTKKNPNTAENAGYMAQILDHKHYSVLEHASVTFYVAGVSRALLAELTRHRMLSFSVESQRYVNYERTMPVIPPALQGTEGEGVVMRAYDQMRERYTGLVHYLTKNEGLSRKQAREAARCVLPNAAPVDMVVTGNLRAWRDVIEKRYHEAADAEIQELGRKLLEHLKEIAPHTFQDMSLEGPAAYERGNGEAK
ncbi:MULTISPECIES: FAD-dependent thymidylate synthase [Streptomyces]